MPYTPNKQDPQHETSGIKMGPAALDHLPTEILHMILSYLGFHCSGKHRPEPPDAYIRGDRQESDQPSWYSLKLQTLLSLCLVSRRLRNAVQPILYHEFVLGYGDSWRSDLYTWGGRLTSFMRTVAQRRDLAALVKRIYIHPYLLECFGEEKEVQVFELSCHRNMWRVIRIEELQQLSAGDLVAVLISELPNLEHFSFQVGPYHGKIVRSAGLRAAGISRLPLRTIDISLRATAREAHYGSLFDLGQTASALLGVSTGLETLNLHMCKGITRRARFPSLPNLKTLRLTFSRLGERDLERLLSSCNGLRSFFYEATNCPFTGYNSSYDCSDHFQLSNAVRYLSRHRATLESLHLDLRKRGHTQDGPEPRAVFSFREFTVLKHLFLNLDEFHTRFWAGTPAEDPDLLVQLLPPSITSLHLAGHITDELPRLEESLLGLAHAASRGQFPRLEEVRWDHKEKLNSEAIVSTAFAAAGVSFGYDRWPMSMSTLGDGGKSPPPRLSQSISVAGPGRTRSVISAE
ncbi:hypothetical protein CNMCM5793_004390 [Aspergillus hiratsukae]|uniref:Leucine-rich repeat domain-containing protein n=1 Tax=Aspergillus hiratsukae TaxID=1194566 RepID=A0A8H6UGG0_9EURO|nr:hypothetical protein CNMCM5793_004390 [Aspergillus hiratsukae]